MTAVDDQILREAARLSPLAFTKLTFPQYQIKWFHRQISDALYKVAVGDIERLMIFMPPRFGKSELVSVRFPAWYLGRYPDRRIIATSYSIDLAEDFGRKSRNLIGTPEYQAIFPGVRVAADSSAASRWDIAGHQGGYVAAGVGGGITGKGANCLSAGTMIQTEDGLMDIAHLVQLCYHRRVLSFNHATGQPEWRRVEAVREVVADGLVEITTSSGRQIRATGNHRIYTAQHGYREARLLQRGDRLVSAEVSSQHDLYCLRRTQDDAKQLTSRVLSGDTQSDGRTALCAVQQGVRASALRIREMGPQGHERCVLLSGVLAQSPCRQVAEAVSGVRKAQARKCQSLLLNRVSAVDIAGPAQTIGEGVRGVRYGVSSAQRTVGLLCPRVCQFCTCKANGRHKQSALQDGHQLCRVLPADAPAHLGARGAPLRGVQGGGEGDALSEAECAEGQVEYCCSPYFRRRAEQQPGEPDSDLQQVPHGAPQIAYDTVSVVRHIRTGPVRVYDFQVEGNRNFFAGALLVHNCLLIDDPFKNRQEAESDTIRDSVWQWYTSTAYTRMEGRGGIVLVLTRWHEDDLAGRLLKEQAQGGDQWHILSLPALSEDNVPLWPEKFPLDVMEQIRRAVGPRDWEALYQQRPAPLEGGIFRREWWQYYTPATLPRITRVEHCIDSSFKTGVANDYSVIATWGRGADTRYYLLDLWRGKWEMPELLVNIHRHYRKHQKAYPGAVVTIEDRASGQSAIQMLKRPLPQLRGAPLPALPVIGFKIPNGASKVSRAEAVSGIVEAGHVCLPERPEWQGSDLETFLREHSSFPNAAHDDQVDTTSQGLLRLAKMRGQEGYDSYAPVVTPRGVPSPRRW